MKALKILKAIEEQEDTHLWLDDGSGYPKKYIIEAIKELEELENRNCKGCKHYGEYEYETCGAEDFTRIIRGCTLMLKIFEDGFYCREWKSKNENL